MVATTILRTTILLAMNWEIPPTNLIATTSGSIDIVQAMNLVAPSVVSTTIGIQSHYNQ